VAVFLQSRNVICSPLKDADAAQEHTYILDYVIQFFITNFGYVNYFNRLFKVHPRSELFQRRINGEYNVDRSRYPILEQFVGSVGRTDSTSLVVTPTSSVPGHYNPEQLTFVYDSDVMQGVPLKTDDVVRLQHQEHAVENGLYKVLDVSASETRLWRLLVKPRAPRSTGEHENVDGYRCVTDPSLRFEHECLSKNDLNGVARRSKHVWDRPCTDSHECPFFRYDPIHKKYDGMCVNGYCQFPNGVERVGFRRFVPVNET
jgi:hypothetical protein